MRCVIWCRIVLLLLLSGICEGVIFKKRKFKVTSSLHDNHSGNVQLLWTLWLTMMIHPHRCSIHRLPFNVCTPYRLFVWVHISVRLLTEKGSFWMHFTFIKPLTVACVFPLAKVGRVTEATIHCDADILAFIQFFGGAPKFCNRSVVRRRFIVIAITNTEKNQRQPLDLKLWKMYGLQVQIPTSVLGKTLPSLISSPCPPLPLFLSFYYWTKCNCD
jgi:hypothetical protein